MKTTSQTITNFIDQQIPDYVQEFYPLFVIFVTKYFEFLENTSNGVQYQLQNIQLNRDIDTTANELAVEFLNTYAPNLPDSSAVDQTILVKYFRDFYKRKGSESSFRFFFKAFFNDDIEIIYPRDYMFNTSGGDWYAEKTIRVRSNIGDPAKLIHTYVTGVTSGARTVVDNVIKLNAAGGVDYYDLVLQPRSWVGNFVTSEAIVGIYYDFENNVSSTVSVTSVTGVLSANGVYRNSRSHLSNDQVLQDSLYFQQFSYVIRSRKDRETWGNSILNHLNPSGLVLFNEYLDDVVTDNLSSATFSKTTLAETTVKIPSIKSYLLSPTFTFDRIADEYTGTATTTIYLTNGTTTSVTYTSIGAIAFDATFDLNAENITFALQKDGDAATLGVPITEITRFDGASFDKFSRAIGLDEQYLAWPADLNSSLVVTRYVAASSNLTAGTLLTSISTTIRTGVTSFATVTSVGSMLLVLTWMKNTRGNNAAGESNNAVIITLSSNATIVPRFDDEVQRNFRYLAVGRSLEYNELIYTHSSNSITAYNVTSGLPLSSTVTNANLVFRPFNWERGLSYDRLTLRLDVDQSLQLNTSLTETFNTANITASGLIASWSSTVTSVSVGYFGTTSTARTAFSSNAFVFNGAAGNTRFVQTVEFPNTQQLNLAVSYIVGDGYNGGDAPESGEDLVVQYSTNGGGSWFTADNLWTAGYVWTFGQENLAGTIWCEPGSNYVTGNQTLFNTQLDVGDVFTIDSSTTTAYTVVSVLNNNIMQISPALVNSFRNSTSIAGTVATAAGSARITGTTTTFNALSIGNNITIGNNAAATSYTIVNIIDDTVIDVTPALVNTTSNATAYLILGTVGFKKLPVSQQLRTTSITVYTGAAVSATTRIIQTGAGTVAVDQDLYAIDNLTVDSFRFQATTGTVNIGIAVSSNSTLNISDTDFFNVTTVGIG